MSDSPEPRHDLSTVDRANLPLFLKEWNGLSRQDREAWADEYIWSRRHHREHEALAAQAVRDADAAEEKKKQDEEAARDREAVRDRKINRRINIGIAVATVLVTAGSFVGTHAGSSTPPAAAQRIVVQFPNGQQITLTPTPTLSPTPGVTEP